MSLQNIVLKNLATFFLSLLVSRKSSCAGLGTFGIFNFLNNKKLLLAFFLKLISLGVGFLNRTGAEIYIIDLINMHNNNIFIIEKIIKYRKCPALFMRKL